MDVPFPCTAIDFETTGAVAGYPVEPWQIGWVELNPGSPPRCRESWLRVGPRPFHPRAPGRHAQLRAELAAAPRLEDCLPDLRKALHGRPLVAHNPATEQKCLRTALPLEPFGPWVDTLKLSRAAWPDAPSHRLEDLLERLDLLGELRGILPGREPHDALFDAYGSTLLLDYLLRQPGWRGVSMAVLLQPDLSAFHTRRIKARGSARGLHSTAAPPASADCPCRSGGDPESPPGPRTPAG